MSVREHLLAIREANGGQLTPEAVVEAARPKTHPLHSRVFDRAPKDAAEAWYRHRAHELIQSVRVRYIANDRPRDVRAFLAVPRPELPQPVYEPTEDVMTDDLARQIVLQNMEREWRTLQARYGDLVEFGEMIRASLSAA